MPPEIAIYSDGACSGNPGPGGYGTILVCGDYEKELSEGFRQTTNNRMEIMGALRGLQALKKPSAVTLVTDSRYLVDTMTKGWAQKWKSKNWMRTEGEKAKNWDLWEMMLPLCVLHRVTWKWVRGHNGHAMNERVDAMAVKARDDKKNHKTDDFFENL